MLLKNEFIKKLLLKDKLKELERKKNIYNEIKENDQIYKYQIKKFNLQWQKISNNNYFYKMWKEKYSLPDQIEKIEDINNYFPILSKKEINNYQDLIFKDLTNFSLIATGGTSGLTTNFPVSKADSIEAYTNAYLGRSWWGIEPLDNILLFWGHSHLFGGGIKGKVNHLKKTFSNYLINTRRISSYSLSPGNVKDFYDEIKKSNPTSIISYTSNLYKICKYMENHNIYYKNSKLKGIILTSESVNDADIQLINKYLNSNVINEYGMAETGPIAYSKDETANIKVLWDSFIVTKKNNELVLSTIGNKLFPLINYVSEDKIVTKDIFKDSILSIEKIEGKCRNILKIPTINNEYKEVSTILFDHIIKYYPNIFSIQYKQLEDKVNIYVTSDKNIDLINLKKYLILKIEQEISDLDSNKINFIQIADIEKTIAGKTKTLL